MTLDIEHIPYVHTKSCIKKRIFFIQRYKYFYRIAHHVIYLNVLSCSIPIGRRVIYSSIDDSHLHKVELLSTLIYGFTALMLSLKRFIAPIALSLMPNRK